MRLFVSIKPPDETLGYLENCIATLSHLNKRLPIKWVDRSLLHNTILFLGEAEEDMIPFIKDSILKSVSKLTTFYLDISSPEIFFKRDRPSVIYMKVFDQSGMLQELHDSLTNELKGRVEFEIKPFSPHLTLGRIKGAIHKNKKINISIGHIDSVFPVEHIELLESVLTPIGPLYTTIFSAGVPHA